MKLESHPVQWWGQVLFVVIGTIAVLFLIVVEGLSDSVLFIGLMVIMMFLIMECPFLTKEKEPDEVDNK